MSSVLTDRVLRIKESPSPLTFGSLLRGRLFKRVDWGDPNNVWIKLDRDFAQVINDENLRFIIASNLPIREVILIQGELNDHS